MTHAKMSDLAIVRIPSKFIETMTFRDQKSLKKLRSCALFINSPSAVLSLHATNNLSFSFLACFGRCQGQRPAIFPWSFCARNWRSWRGTSWVQSFSVTVSGLLYTDDFTFQCWQKLEHSCTHGFLMWNSSWVTMWRQDNVFTDLCHAVQWIKVPFVSASILLATLRWTPWLNCNESLPYLSIVFSSRNFTLSIWCQVSSGSWNPIFHIYHSNRLPVEVHQCREVLALWCLCTAGQGHAVAGGAARGRDQRWEAYGITGVDVFWWETRAFWRHLTRWKWRLRDINFCIMQI